MSLTRKDRAGRIGETPSWITRMNHQNYQSYSSSKHGLGGVGGFGKSPFQAKLDDSESEIRSGTQKSCSH